jgi:hypothetical protein
MMENVFASIEDFLRDVEDLEVKNYSLYFMIYYFGHTVLKVKVDPFSSQPILGKGGKQYTYAVCVSPG